ncbi:MAG TPA: hypothetical protein VIF60_06880 [Burkholderiaceae bacterium]|jgi:hypothetical protein
MRGFWLVPVLFLGLSGMPCRAADCATYTGSAAAVTKDVAGVLDKTLAAVRSKNARGVFALADKKILLVRRVVSSSTDRSGNLRLELRQRDLDANLNIHMGNQVLPDLSLPGAFASIPTDNIINVRRDICEDARRCDDNLPGSEQIPFMINDLLQCNHNGKAAYMFSDGIYLTDMTVVAGKLPTGSALFFNKTAAGFRLAGVIIQN